MSSARTLKLSAWGLAAIVCGLALGQWIAHLPQHALGIYDIFPIFGLIAFSLMWTHYVTGSLQRLFHQPASVLRTYFTITAGIVLGCIILHPVLLWWQLWRDGLGLPPLSYLNLYIDLGGRTALILGSLSLAIFLSFEFRRKFDQKPWWKYIEYLNVAAMFAILIHGFILGTEVKGWFRIIWILYAVILLGSLAYNRYYDHRARNNP